MKDAKDVTKSFGEKATRFLPVDMKDRLKSVFNRGSTPAAPTSAPDDDVPDYGAIFNANKAPGAQKKPRFNGPLEPAQLAQPPGVNTIKPTPLQEALEIEEAEVVSAPPLKEPLVRPEWEEASLSSKPRKAETPIAAASAEPESPKPAKAAELADDVPDYSAIFKANKSKSADKAPARPHFDASAFDRNSEDKSSSAVKPAEVIAADKPAVKPEEKKAPLFTPEKPAEKTAQMTSANGPQAERKPETKQTRFGDLSATEHVRLKVEPRNEARSADEGKTSEPRGQEIPAAKPRAEEPQPVMASSGYQRAPEPSRPEPKSPEAKARNTEEHLAAGFAYEAKPLEQPREFSRGASEPIAARTANPEQNKINQKEKSSMADVKGQESDNGTATVRNDATNIAAIAIERNSKFSGQLKFSGQVSVDGQVEGELVAERVVIHEGGVVNATVEGNSVVIAGTVKGDIYARTELEILPSGVIHGSVTSPTINVRRGGRVEGRCAIGVPRQ
jgi:cytoskeletal protein CcmA (bactofilin family)